VNKRPVKNLLKRLRVVYRIIGEVWIILSIILSEPDLVIVVKYDKCFFNFLVF
jgi:hypothetical protein